MTYIGLSPILQIFKKSSFTGDGSTTSFNLVDPVTSVNSLLVIAGGVPQEPSEAFTIESSPFANTLEFAEAPGDGVDIYAIWLGLSEADDIDLTGFIQVTGSPSVGDLLIFDDPTWVPYTGLKDTVDGIITTGGSSTAYTAAANRTISTYYDGLQLTVEFHTASGATPTLNVDSVGAQSLVWPDGTAVGATEISANLFAKVIYDETNTNWVVLTTTGLALVAGDIGSTVQAYDADTSKLDVAETRSASLNFADQEAIRPKLKDYGETVNAIGSIGGGTQDIDLALGNVVTGTVDTSETTFTFSNPSASGTACSFTLILTNGGSQTVNWPATVDWPGGAAPSLTASGVDVISFYTTDGGTTWYGVSALNFS